MNRGSEANLKPNGYLLLRRHGPGSASGQIEFNPIHRPAERLPWNIAFHQVELTTAPNSGPLESADVVSGWSDSPKVEIARSMRFGSPQESGAASFQPLSRLVKNRPFRVAIRRVIQMSSR